MKIIFKFFFIFLSSYKFRLILIFSLSCTNTVPNKISFLLTQIVLIFAIATIASNSTPEFVEM